MPHYQFSSEHGDLFVTYEVDFPKELTKEQRELVEKMQNVYK